MKVLVITQNDNMYLPNALGEVSHEFRSEITCIISAPPGDIKGGYLKRINRYLSLFGVPAFAHLAINIAVAKCKNKLLPPKPMKFYSLRSMAGYYAIPFYEITNLKSHRFIRILSKHKADLLVSMSCPQIIDKETRSKFPMGCINVHGSPLPKYRGLMPAFWVLRNGESETASTVHELSEHLDDGDILEQIRVSITSDDTWDSLVRKTKRAGAKALIQAIRKIESAETIRRPNLANEATFYKFPSQKDRDVFLSAGRRFF